MTAEEEGTRDRPAPAVPAGGATGATAPVALPWRQAAIYLGYLKRSKFYEIAGTPGFPAPVFYGGRRRWLVEELRQWVLLQRPVPLTSAEREILARPTEQPRRIVGRRRQL
jgi:predicted DNA-binding transcriptional regulator AlpA